MVRALTLKVLDRDAKEVSRVEVDTDMLKTYIEKKKDLGTDWFARILYSAFASVHPVVTTTREDGGTDASGASFCYGCCRCHIWIGVGTGTTPPTRQDYKLEAEKDVKPATARYIDGTGVVIITTSFVFNQDIDISEVGLFLCDGDINAGGPGARTLLDRTVLDAPVHVAAQQTLYVEYRIAV
ncbi:MAG: hypothetical protein B7O98_09480 [Zestosphaera tikiterensis]|uniref:Uncharacterized protein n=1 Tax=Zestosphaera tikiterensis TaxID=1973259 RepID=A0A2R7Y1G6_9CREN|nr:MAG: hypothetical protein B7O98_09480 [Zestosphaera tikiterensis]